MKYRVKYNRNRTQAVIKAGRREVATLTKRSLKRLEARVEAAIQHDKETR